MIKNKLNSEVTASDSTMWRSALYIFIFMKTNFSELVVSYFLLLCGNQQLPTILKIRYQKYFPSNLFQEPRETRNPGRSGRLVELSNVNSDCAIERAYNTESCRPFVLHNFMILRSLNCKTRKILYMLYYKD